MNTINFSQTDLPAREELLEVLSSQFEPLGYECFLFGYGPGKSIMVKKNAFVGVRIYLDTNKKTLLLKGSPGIPWLVGVPFVLLIGVAFSMYKGLKEEVYTFLSEKLNS